MPVDATIRSAVVLGAAALLVVPLVNALVLDARQTADRQIRDPPEDPPPVEATPEDRRNSSRQIPRSRGGAAGGNCTPVPEENPAVRWRHPSPAEEPGAAAQTRAQSADTKRFEISKLHPAARVQLNVSDLTGSLTARVYPDGESEDAPFTVTISNRVTVDVARGKTLTRAGALSTGTWTASLETDGATYDELAFTVVRAICQEGAS